MQTLQHIMVWSHSLTLPRFVMLSFNISLFFVPPCFLIVVVCMDSDRSVQVPRFLLAASGFKGGSIRTSSSWIPICLQNIGARSAR